MITIVRRMLALLEPRARRMFYVSSLAMLGLAVLEALALLTVAPLMLILTSPNLQSSSSLVHALSDALGNPPPGQLALDLGVATVVIYVFKDVAAIAVTRQSIGFILRQEAILVRRLMGLYLHGPFREHLRLNSSELIRTLTDSTRSIFSKGMVSSFTVLADGFSVAFVGIILLIANPLVAVCSLAYFCLTGYVYQKVVQRDLGKKVEHLHVEQARDFRTIHQAVVAVKEIKVRGREDYYTDEVFKLRKGLVPAYRSMAMINITPRYVIELAMVGATTTIALVAYTTEPVTQATAVVGLFLVGGTRLLAPLNKIIFGIATARSVGPSVTQVERDIEIFSPASVPAPDRGLDSPPVPAGGPAGLAIVAASAPDGSDHQIPRINVEDVWFSYLPGQPVLREVSFEIRPGEAIGLVGGSGAGKSTMMDILLGLLEPDRGRVLVDGKPMQAVLRSWHDRIGYVPQTIALFDDTIRANVALGISSREELVDSEVWIALRAAQLEQVVQRLPEGLDTVIGEGGVRLSGGQRQRLGMARALYHGPTVLMLDEATSALDNETEFRLTEVLDRLRGQLTTITIAHRLSTVRRCDRVLYLEDGRLQGTGTFAELAAEIPGFARLVELSDVTGGARAS